MKRIDLIILRLTFVFCILLSCFMIFSLVLLFAPYKIIEFKYNPIKVDQKTPIYAGDFVPVHWQFKKYTDTPAQVFVTLVNGRQIILDEVWSAKLPGEYDYIGSQFQIPRNFISPGWWHVKIQFRYRINPLREEVININTEKFEIKQQPVAPDQKKKNTRRREIKSSVKPAPEPLFNGQPHNPILIFPPGVDDEGRMIDRLF